MSVLTKYLPASLILLLTLSLGAPGNGFAQDPTPQGEVDQAQVQDWLRELREIHDRLEMLQELALQDEGLKQTREELGEAIRQRVEEIDPAHSARMERAVELEQEMQAASEAGDEETMGRLTEEAELIERAFFAAQQEALSQPAIARKMTEFQTRLQARMYEIDPDAERLIGRMQELQERLAALAR